MIYNPITNQWSTGRSLPEARYRHAAVLIGTDIYLFGGRDVAGNILKTVSKYSISTNTHTVVITNHTQATSDNAGFADGSTAYVYGGYNVDYSAATKECYMLDTRASTPSMQVFGYPLWQGRGDFSIVKLGSHVYAIGGFDGTFAPMKTTMRLTLPATAGWTNLASTMGNGRGDFAAAVFENKILAIGGENGTDSLTAGAGLRYVEAFDGATQQWLGPET